MREHENEYNDFGGILMFSRVVRAEESSVSHHLIIFERPSFSSGTRGATGPVTRASSDPRASEIVMAMLQFLRVFSCKYHELHPWWRILVEDDHISLANDMGSLDDSFMGSCPGPQKAAPLSRQGQRTHRGRKRAYDTPVVCT